MTPRYALRIRGARIAGTIALSVTTLRAAQAVARQWRDALAREVSLTIVEVETGVEVWGL